MRGYWFITFFVGIQLLPLIIPLNNSPEKKTALKFLTKHVFKKFYIVENAWGGWEELSRFCILIICFWGFFVHCILCRSVQSLCFWESYKMTHTVTSESPHYIYRSLTTAQSARSRYLYFNEAIKLSSASAKAVFLYSYIKDHMIYAIYDILLSVIY